MIKWTGHLIWMLDLLFSYSYSSAEVITIANEVKLYILENENVLLILKTHKTSLQSSKSGIIGSNDYKVH